MKLITITLFLITCLLSFAASAVSTEALVVESIERGIGDTIIELEEVVNINSDTLNIEGVTRVGQVFRRHFDDLGFMTHWVDGKGFDRAGHLLASNFSKPNSSPKLKVLLIGHLDTVFSQKDSFQKFVKVDNNHVSGPGVIDMKGGNMIIIAALRALKNAGTLNDLAIKVILTGDEERSGRPLSASKKALIDAAKWADIALGFEDGDGDIKTAVIARRGSVSWELAVTGKPAHSSQIFQTENGYGAIFEAARILNQMRIELAGLGNLTFNPGLIGGGTRVEHEAAKSTSTVFGKNNVIAKVTKVYGDIRALDHEELDQAKITMQKIVANNLDQTSAQLKFNEGYPPMPPTAKNRELLNLYSQVSEDLGFGVVSAVNPRKAGAADISFAAAHVEMSLDGLGMMGSGGHTIEEVGELDSLSRNAKKAAVLLLRLAEAHRLKTN